MVYSKQVAKNIELCGAVISPCGKYRTRLWRIWDATKPPLLAICLNPSTADENVDDATVRRLRGYAKRFGAGGLVLINLYSYRATQPSELYKAVVECRADPPSGSPLLNLLAELAPNSMNPALAAWGDGIARSQDMQTRAKEVSEMMWFLGRELACLGQTKNGNPRHPLRLRADQPLVSFPK